MCRVKQNVIQVNTEICSQLQIMYRKTIHCMPYTGNIWRRKISANHTGKSYWQEKIWWIATVSSYAIYVFHVFVNIGEENFGEWLTIRQNRQFFPLPKFSRVRYIRIVSWHLNTFVTEQVYKWIEYLFQISLPLCLMLSFLTVCDINETLHKIDIIKT